MITSRDVDIVDLGKRLSLDDVTLQHNKKDAIEHNFRGHAQALKVACQKDKFPCVVLEDNVMFR